MTALSCRDVLSQSESLLPVAGRGHCHLAVSMQKMLPVEESTGISRKRAVVPGAPRPAAVVEVQAEMEADAAPAPGAKAVEEIKREVAVAVETAETAALPVLKRRKRSLMPKWQTTLVEVELPPRMLSLPTELLPRPRLLPRATILT